ncbi:MAG: glycosyltransferase [Actinomycetales bacterium]|nr:glycosyltransferase [Tetrasphaera sp.]NLX00753.1 glycosyltransferase [Actinomycetales bacterium]
MAGPSGVAAIIPAKDEAERIAATIASIQGMNGVDLVVVVDDGSTDGTAQIAEAAGAVVVRHPENKGKAAAMASGAQRVAEEDRREGLDVGRALLFVDADLADSAANLAPLLPPVLLGRADLAIANLPVQRAVGGGRGRVVRLAQRGIFTLTGYRAVQPLSGQRCITREAFEAALPLARGWGVEVGMTVDVLQAGYTVTEVPCDVHHRVTGSDWRGKAHRAKQMRDVAWALAVREAPRAHKDAPALAKWSWHKLRTDAIQPVLSKIGGRRKGA